MCIRDRNGGGEQEAEALFAEVDTVPTALPDLADISEEYGEAAAFFQREMDNKLLIVADFNADDHPAQSICMEQLVRLEKEYETLREDLLESNGNARVVSSMIHNYRTRLHILDRLLKQLEATNQQNLDHETSTI